MGGALLPVFLGASGLHMSGMVEHTKELGNNVCDVIIVHVISGDAQTDAETAKQS